MPLNSSNKTFTLIPSDAYRVMPWKNGGGVTHEIAAEEEQEPGWRLSIATIDRDGPFSDFSGYDRTIMTIDGGDVELHFHDDGTVVTLKQYRPFRFAGERKVSCRLLNGPVRDFNVITKRVSYSHEVNVGSTESGLVVGKGELCFVLIFRGKISQPVAAVAGDTLKIEGPASMKLACGDEATMYALVRIIDRRGIG